MALDATTQANLELFRNTVSGTSGGSLLSVIDLTKTSMGGRMLKRRLGQPLLDLKELTKNRTPSAGSCKIISPEDRLSISLAKSPTWNA
jgi:DNA mismatch repair ATPase MutS